jgi:thiol-disulfide isomerase/thioredoxin
MKLLNTISALALLIFSLSLSAVAISEDIETVENFSFKDIKGKTHQFSEYRGKWVIVNYWGTYCPPCLEEIPDLVNFSDNHKKDAVVLGMDAGGTNITDLTEFAAENMMDYLIAPVQESTLTAFGILTGIPTTYVVTPSGEVAAKVVGIINLKAVEQLMQQYAGTETTTETTASTAKTKPQKESDSILDL